MTLAFLSLKWIFAPSRYSVNNPNVKSDFAMSNKLVKIEISESTLAITSVNVGDVVLDATKR